MQLKINQLKPCICSIKHAKYFINKSVKNVKIYNWKRDISSLSFLMIFIIKCFLTLLQTGLNLQPPDDCLFGSLGNQFWFQASNTEGILNTCTRLWLTESEPVTPVD